MRLRFGPPVLYSVDAQRFFRWSAPVRSKGRGIAHVCLAVRRPVVRSTQLCQRVCDGASRQYRSISMSAVHLFIVVTPQSPHTLLSSWIFAKAAYYTESMKGSTLSVNDVKGDKVPQSGQTAYSRTGPRVEVDFPSSGAAFGSCCLGSASATQPLNVQSVRLQVFHVVQSLIATRL